MTVESLFIASDVILAGLALTVGIPSMALLGECVASLLPSPRPKVDPSLPRPRIAVLVPAHNEKLHIGATVAALKAQLGKEDRLLVVADNCSDNTADLARQAGAEVLERNDTINRGKGFALAAGVAQLGDQPPDVLLLFDADVIPPPGTIETLALRAKQSQLPVQAIYLLHAAAKDPGVRATVSELAFIMKNSVRPRGLHRLGLSVPLTGIGIGLPWKCVQAVELASSDLVEDMKLGLDLLAKGYPPQLCPEIVIDGELPDKTTAAATQRTRWEHGHLLTLTRWGPKLIAKALTTGRLSLLAAAIDLAIPPLALLAMLQVLLAVATVSYGLVLTRWLPAFIIIAAIVALAVSVAIAWLSAARHLSMVKILGAPFYILWKLPLYLKFLTGRSQTTWIRTERTLDRTSDKG